jgi:hypothetical protein
VLELSTGVPRLPAAARSALEQPVELDGLLDGSLQAHAARGHPGHRVELAEDEPSEVVAGERDLEVRRQGSDLRGLLEEAEAVGTACVEGGACPVDEAERVDRCRSGPASPG